MRHSCAVCALVLPDSRWFDADCHADDSYRKVSHGRSRRVRKHRADHRHHGRAREPAFHVRLSAHPHRRDRRPDAVTAAIARHVDESGSVFLELPDGRVTLIIDLSCGSDQDRRRWLGPARRALEALKNPQAARLADQHDGVCAGQGAVCAIHATFVLWSRPGRTASIGMPGLRRSIRLAGSRLLKAGEETDVRIRRKPGQPRSPRAGGAPADADAGGAQAGAGELRIGGQPA